MKVTKPVAIGAGLTVGTIQSYLTRIYLNYPIPIISDYLGNWGTTATFGNIATGAILAGLGFTGIIKNKMLSLLLKTYGLTAVAGGFINGIFPPIVLRAPLQQRAMTSSGDGYYTEEYYPEFKGQFYRRPESRARGFASDVTKQPMAMIPTEVPYNKILF